jgi:hypothetical protein
MSCGGACPRPSDKIARGSDIWDVWWTWSGSNRRPLPCHLRNINHLQAGTPETQDLAQADLDAGGRHGRGFHNLESTRTPGLHARGWHAACFSRAVVGQCDCCLLEETTIGFHIRTAVARVSQLERSPTITRGDSSSASRPTRRAHHWSNCLGSPDAARRGSAAASNNSPSRSTVTGRESSDASISSLAPVRRLPFGLCHSAHTLRSLCVHG